MKRTGSSNVNLRLLISNLRKLASKEKAPVWKKAADELARPSRQRRVVNLSKIDKYARPGEVVVVLGKVLGNGSLGEKLEVVAFSFSETAKRKISSSGKATSLKDYLKSNPKGKKVRIIG